MVDDDARTGREVTVVRVALRAKLIREIVECDALVSIEWLLKLASGGLIQLEKRSRLLDYMCNRVSVDGHVTGNAGYFGMGRHFPCCDRVHLHAMTHFGTEPVGGGDHHCEKDEAGQEEDYRSCPDYEARAGLGILEPTNQLSK